MNHPIKKLRHNIDTQEVSFETEHTDLVGLVDTLLDLRAAFDEALYQAYRLSLSEPARRYRFTKGKLTSIP